MTPNAPYCSGRSSDSGKPSSGTGRVCPPAVASSALGTMLSCFGGSLSASAANAEPGRRDPPSPGSLWARENLVPWEAAPLDTKKRYPEERAEMFEHLGLRHYAYLSSTDPWDSKNDVNISQHEVESEIEAMQRHGIDILAWYFWVNTNHPAEVPKVRETLESFKRHRIHPQIWMAHSFAYYPKTPDDWARFVPLKFADLAWARTSHLPVFIQQYGRLTAEEKGKLEKIYSGAIKNIETDNYPKTPREREERVQREADRIQALVKLAAPYDCRVNIYNHRGWFGMMDNELAILQRLEELGVKDVGLVYNFSHSRDAFHDDSKDFPQLWEKIKPHVVTVNIAGLYGSEVVGLPSQGDRELAMMRVIQESGWKGPVGVLAAGFDDMEVVLRDALRGVDWLSAELERAGSGGPPPLPNLK